METGRLNDAGFSHIKFYCPLETGDAVIEADSDDCKDSGHRDCVDSMWWCDR